MARAIPHLAACSTGPRNSKAPCGGAGPSALSVRSGAGCDLATAVLTGSADKENQEDVIGEAV